MKLLISWHLSHQVRRCGSRQGRPIFHYDTKQCWRRQGIPTLYYDTRQCLETCWGHLLLCCRQHDNPTTLLTAMSDLIGISLRNDFGSSLSHPNTFGDDFKECF